ncbi:MAG TPA: serine/threonine-protein kinase [Kofleriaceae bacterium]|nr:serine/threonine-protein kinase [Kofleriaceae bacterium]
MPALGRYELLRPLARGGMADVYLARRRVAGVEKRLVIKRLRRDRHRDPRFLDMFIREAQLSMSLVQQNIVPVFDFGRIGDHVFLAMEYIEGRDLGSSLFRQRGSGMPPMLAAFVAAECCHALDHAHRRREQVIHRDVTARNVLLSWEGEVKLADFGIAAVVGEAAGLFGTPAYMAPEQANGVPVDARADVYALGIVLWESLTGDHVRPADDRTATIAVARSGELPEIPASIPPALADVIRRATAVDPEARFSTAQEMAEALDAFMIGERVREGGLAPTKRLEEWLAARWGDERDAPADADVVPDGSAIVTFLDDGEQSIRGGSHTQRSVAETAADEDEPPPSPPPQPPRARTGTAPPPAQVPRAGTLPLPSPTRRAGTVPPPTGRGRPTTAPPPVGRARPATTPPPAAPSPARLLLPSDGHAVIDPWAPRGEAAAAAPDADAHDADDADADALAADARAGAAAALAANARAGAAAPAAAPSPARRRVLLGALALALAAGLVLAYLAGASRRDDAPADAPQVALAAPDAAGEPSPGPDAAPAPAPDATDEPPSDAAPVPDADDRPRRPTDAAIVRVVPRAADAGIGPGPGSGEGSAAAAGPLRPLWINALPWAFFTVDGDPKQHETPAMLKLPVGAHRVTFTNPQLGVSRTVTVIVPAQGEARHVEKMN